MRVTGRLSRQGVMLVFIVWTAASCALERPPRGAPNELRGWVVSEPLPKPDFTLTTMQGEPFDFREQTDGYLTLLFFGYTFCPDICPVHMANIAAVLEKMPPRQASRVKVVFVTTDPERDTPERMREWLGYFNPHFIGLIGPLDRVNAIQRAIGLGAAVRQDLPDGGYGVAHAAQVLAYTADDQAHVMYAFGTRQEDWAHDLPLLVEGPPTP